MIKKPAQHTAVTFLSQRGIGVTTLLLVILLFPILLLLAIAVKVGIVLGLHFVLEYLAGSWLVLYTFAVLVGLFTVLGFISRTLELGRYYTGLKIYEKSSMDRFWHGIVFAVDFVVTDMLTLTASAILAYVYWVAAATQSYAVFYQFLQPFIGLSILGGLLQILFSSYYLTHEGLRKVYLYATGQQSWSTQSKKARKSVKRKPVKRRTTSKKRVSRKGAKKLSRKTAKRSSKKKKRTSRRR